MSSVVSVTENVNDIEVTAQTYEVNITNGAAFTATLNDLTDVNTSGVTNNQFISYNAATSTWLPVSSSATVTHLDDIGDVVLSAPSDNQFLTYDAATSTWVNETVSAGSGITRSVLVRSTTTSAGGVSLTDYVYLCSGTFTITLPTAVSNTDRYTIKNTNTGTITIATTSSQTIDGSLTAALSVQYTSLDLISDGSNWSVI